MLGPHRRESLDPEAEEDFSVKESDGKHFRLVGHLISIAATQLCCFYFRILKENHKLVAWPCTVLTPVVYEAESEFRSQCLSKAEWREKNKICRLLVLALKHNS